MSYSSSKKYSSASEYNVIYSDFKGVDFSENGSRISPNRLSYAENMYRDYDRGGANTIESIPGYRKIYDCKKKVNGLYSYKNSENEDVLVIHAGNELYSIPISDVDTCERVSVFSGVSDLKGASYASGSALFVLDGTELFMISDAFSGRIRETSSEVYVPTTHVDGTEYEQRNLLTGYFYEQYTTPSEELHAFATKGLRYVVTDVEKNECSVSGITGEASSIYVPSRVKIGSSYYHVKGVEAYAFADNKSITECHIASGVSYLGEGAFKNCTSLALVALPDTVALISDLCFKGCSSLLRLYIGASLKSISETAFDGCDSLECVCYSADAERFETIENYDLLRNTLKYYNKKRDTVRIELKLHNPTVEVIEVTDGENALDYSVIRENGLCRSISLYIDSEAGSERRSITVKGLLSSSREDYGDRQTGFISSNLRDGDAVSKAITECTVAESFDGRIFLTGNPKYPGVCFYSSFDRSGENHPLYFGEMNYFKDGTGSFANTALLAVGDSLAVFKAGDDGGGSIYYHTPSATGVDVLTKIYPVSYVHSGFLARGDAISFFDDPVFVSDKGISALCKKNINLERSIATRSSNVNKRLLSENLKEIKLAVWKGYLVVLAEGKIYLADSRATFVSRSGDVEYEWFYLCGIGSYKNDKTVYRYSPTAHDGFYAHERTDAKVYADVFSIKKNGETVYYVNGDGKRFEVYPTEEKHGGAFCPATHVISIADRLIFATGDGQAFIFNTDMRGVAPPYLRDSEGFDEEDYKSAWEDVLHPYYYSFAAHATRYAVQTKRDDCSIPHFTKNTVKNSLIVKCRALLCGRITCEVGTDVGGYKEIADFPSSEFFFADVDFSNLSLTTDSVYTLPLREKEKGWIEKDIALYSDEFASPFAISVIAYRFRVKGNIKRNR